MRRAQLFVVLLCLLPASAGASSQPSSPGNGPLAAANAIASDLSPVESGAAWQRTHTAVLLLESGREPRFNGAVGHSTAAPQLPPHGTISCVSFAGQPTCGRAGQLTYFANAPPA